VLFIFSAAPCAMSDALAHIAVHVELTRIPDGSPSRWLPWLVAPAARVAQARIPHATVLASALADRERVLLADAQREAGPVAVRWQPSLFDRRALLAIEALRSTAATRIDAHHARIRELERHLAIVPGVEPVLALVLLD
jgi:hypothetical protein